MRYIDINGTGAFFFLFLLEEAIQDLISDRVVGTLVRQPTRSSSIFTNNQMNSDKRLFELGTW